MREQNTPPSVAVQSGLEMHFWNLAYNKIDHNINLSNTRLLYSLWSINKEELSIKTSAIAQVFTSFSDHGPKHSQAVLGCIDRVLGERINQLGPTDIWLLLECAYRHDVGMHIPGEDIARYLETDDYCELLNNLQESEDEDLRKAALSLINPVVSNNADEFNKQIYRLSKNQNIVLQQYFRKNHAKRSNIMILSENESADNVHSSMVPMRFWKLVAKICLGHSLNRERLMDDTLLPQETDGFCGDVAHPRFVAYMLRLGDLLDLDNNRFNRYQLALWGKDIPGATKNNIGKHKAINHLRIKPESIDIAAEIYTDDPLPAKQKKQALSDDRAVYKKEVSKLSKEHRKLSANELMYKLDAIRWSENEKISHQIHEDQQKQVNSELTNETCDTIANWFKWIEDELKHIAQHWLEIKPKKLDGNIPRLRTATISLNGCVLNKDTIKLKYSISHKRAAKIIQGTGLYGLSEWGTSDKQLAYNNQLVFLREFLQNAIDATCIQVFRYLLQGRYGNPFYKFGRLLDSATLCDNGCEPTEDSEHEYANMYTDWHPIEVFRGIGKYVEQLNVELRIRYYSRREDCLLLFIIRDKGTGIDEEALKNMKLIGETRSQSMMEEINSMPEWLRPSGSFGIGMQSVYGVVPQFTATSGSRKDHVIRELYFKNDHTSGRIFAIDSKLDVSQTLNYGTQFVIPMTVENVEVSKLYATDGKDVFDRRCETLFANIQKDLDFMTGQHLFPFRIRYFIDDVEVVSLKKQNEYDYLFKPLLECKEDCKAKCDCEGKCKATELDINQDGSYTRVVNKKSGLYIYSYQTKENIFVEMQLSDFGSEGVLNTQQLSSSNVLLPMDFYYKGLRVATVKDNRQLNYPCWNVKAYGFFGNAEDYVSEDRNRLIQSKANDVHQLILNSSDKALAVFWKSVYADNDKKYIVLREALTKEQKNALAISYIYQKITEKLKPAPNNSNYYSCNTVIEQLFNNVTCRVAAIHNQYGNLEEVTTQLNTIFNGECSFWLLHKNMFVDNAISYSTNDEVAEIIVKDVFSDYLLARGLSPKVSKYAHFNCNITDHLKKGGAIIFH